MNDSKQLTIRRATSEDLGSIVDVCGEALQWSHDSADAEFFRWKHLENPFGPSPMWVAEESEGETKRIVGVRAMMCWQLQGPTGDILQLSRAVDTATLPSHQGRGIFSKLTMAAVDELTEDGVDAIFNTPNDKSRPGYLKMGWRSLGRVPVAVRPRNPKTLVTMTRSKVPAERWGIQTQAGLAPADAFAETARLAAVLKATPRPARWSTPLTESFLRWRTSFDLLACRIEPLGATIEDGFIVFRLRNRGPLRQLSVLFIVRPEPEQSLRRAIGRLMRSTEADIAMVSGRQVGLGAGLIALPGAGPQLTWRALANAGPHELADLDLPLGAIELF